MKPVPVPDRYSECFWNAARDGRLAFQQCLACSKLIHPPEPVCPHCRSLEQGFGCHAVSGKATLRTWTVTRRPFIPAFRDEAPYVTAVGELPEQPGLLLLARLDNADPAALRVGLALDVGFVAIDGGMRLPRFRLIPEGSA